MLSKKLLPISIVLLCILSASVYYFKNEVYTIEVPIKKIQGKLNEKLPIKKNMAVISITLSDPKVGFASQKNKLSLGLNVDVNMITKKYSGSIEMVTDVSYNKEKGQINLVDPEINSIKIPDFPGDKLQMIQLGLNQITKGVIESIPVYTIEPKNAKLFAARHLLQQLKVQEPGIVVTLGIN